MGPVHRGTQPTHTKQIEEVKADPNFPKSDRDRVRNRLVVYQCHSERSEESLLSCDVRQREIPHSADSVRSDDDLYVVRYFKPASSNKLFNGCS